MSVPEWKNSSSVAISVDDRAQECMERAAILWAQYEDTWDDGLLNQTIDFEREALRLCLEGHPNRHSSCGNLAISLRTLYNRTGDSGLLTEAIDLGREALRLCPEGHPDRHRSCGSLASSLRMLYDRTGDDGLLTEAIDLEREALRLCPEGHPDRHRSCGSLASSLWTLYNRTGNEGLLTEAIDLEREALKLCPEGHPLRHSSCGSVAISLRTLYNRTGDEGLLTESIDLHREALRLRPEGHPDRHLSCGSLATSLWTLYNRTGDEGLLTEAIDLHREALRLLPECHPDRDISCGNLASSLWTLYNRTGDEDLLTEAIDLECEALKLRPEGHPDRHLSCENLASSFWRLYNGTGDEGLLTDAISLYHTGADLAPAQDKWRKTIQLSSIHLMQQTSHYNIDLAVQYLTQSLQDMPDNPSGLISRALVILDTLWVESSKTMSLIPFILEPVYQQIIVFLPLLSSPAFDLASQFQRLRDVRQVGADACINSVIAGDLCAGLEHLEVAQGLIWAQRLHQRDPQFRDVPEAQRAELELCLRALARHNAVPTAFSLERSSELSRDELHRYSSRMYAVIRQIRAEPGLERFMLGETCETLCGVAIHHLAVVLVGGHGRFYALIIRHGQICGNGLLKLDLTEEILDNASVYERLTSQRGDMTPKVIEGPERGMQVLRTLTPLDHYLRSLWLKVVKPVLDVLQLQVRKHI
jgi:tetratricopeptide (TPR) repeat protein